jgi:transcriptional regulator with XRE-family HTH domain
MLKAAFGKQLQKLREEREITQDKLAEAVGVSESRIIRYWERGTFGPEFERLENIAKALNIRVRDLFDFPDTSL